MTVQGDDDELAAAVYRAELEQRASGRVGHGLRITGAFLAQLAWGLVPGPAVHDVVVRRRDDGVEVVRVPVEDPTAPGVVLQAIRDELDAVGPAEFLAGWSARTG